MERYAERLRVAIISDYPINDAEVRGGVQAACTYLVRGLAKLSDVEINVLTFKRPNWKGPDRIELENVTLHLLSVYPRFERLRNYRIYQSTIDRKLAEIEPDIVHAQDTSAQAYVSLKSGYPTVVTVHSIQGEDGKYYTSWGRRLRSYFDSALIEHYVFSHAQHLITISKYITDYFATSVRPNLNVYYLPNAIDERFFNLSGSSDGKIILFAGRVIPRKRVEDLIRAFSCVVQQIPSAQLRIAGECSSEKPYVASVYHWINRCNLGDHVKLLGQLSEPSVMREFACCNLLALPSAQETTPMVLAQAMATGKPVVATRVGGVAEMVGEKNERGILVEVGDIDGLAQAMLRLLQNPLLRTRMGQAGQVFARENYHLDNVARRTNDVYKNIMASEQRHNA
jgi:glycosyltransferase involved in cell wall biosynthesis